MWRARPPTRAGISEAPTCAVAGASILPALLRTHQVSLGLRELLKPAATHRLGELLKLYGCEDLVTSVDEVGIEEFLEIKYLCMGGIARKGADDGRARSQASSSAAKVAF